jgi:hypothetical protein
VVIFAVSGEEDVGMGGLCLEAALEISVMEVPRGCSPFFSELRCGT